MHNQNDINMLIELATTYIANNREVIKIIVNNY